jgi:polar amino acid transport system substrate-binding protein
MIGSGMTVTQERNLRLNFSDLHRGRPDRAAAPSLAGTSSIKDLTMPATASPPPKAPRARRRPSGFLGAARLTALPRRRRVHRGQSARPMPLFTTPTTWSPAVARKTARCWCWSSPSPSSRWRSGEKGDFDSLNWINHCNQVAQDGTYDRLHDKWFKDTAWLEDID